MLEWLVFHGCPLCEVCLPYYNFKACLTVIDLKLHMEKYKNRWYLEVDILPQVHLCSRLKFHFLVFMFLSGIWSKDLIIYQSHMWLFLKWLVKWLQDQRPGACGDSWCFFWSLLGSNGRGLHRSSGYETLRWEFGLSYDGVSVMLDHFHKHNLSIFNSS